MAGNRVILSAAGSRKTQRIVDEALAAAAGGGRVLVATYTNENRRLLVDRIENRVGVVPPNILVMGWFSFLISQCAKPYQRAFIGKPNAISGLNFKGRKPRGASKDEVRYFFDKNCLMLRDGVSDFVVVLNTKTDGAVVERLERAFTHILIDEVQDLVGFDLDVIDLLLKSSIDVLMVGDPRQHTIATNIGPRNKKYRGTGLASWFVERADTCSIEENTNSYRCNQAICDFADALYPGLPRTTSVDVPETDHDGIFVVPTTEVHEYSSTKRPVMVLRYSKVTDTSGLTAMNIGVAKGSTFDRVLIFPTKPMVTYLKDGDPSALKAPESLYVATTRARFSVAFVLPASLADSLAFPVWRADP